jgi:hypothetical protein
VEAGGFFLERGAAFALIAFALALFGIGECFHGPAHQALVAEIAPDHLRGRYFAVHSLPWGLAGTVGPAGVARIPRREVPEPSGARCGNSEVSGAPPAGRLQAMPVVPVIEDPLSTDAEPASHPAPAVARDGRRRTAAAHRAG